ncbi:glycoside hydrolase family 71 protein [Neolentinus lepideus HHB14362 ss-1]|uniref:Glycoside hydrolase family 71 protein n=1 Tax=Neolentinus lepideus HHB14362 ss-1 TaxID=1314782 RepID=A0A165Q482_9AGAM|nr:glycoside hydrolase family 71 protein [Neolentinus lepideus HHB14362 ss-1]
MVFAHFIVGNTRPYTVQDWAKDIALAASKGIDAFALNVGRDDYEASRVADAYTAASGTNFKLFLSFDMTSFPCSGPGDAYILRDYITRYQAHPSQLRYDGKILVSTFGGEYCSFGTGSLNQGWQNAIKSEMPPVHFVPAFFLNAAAFTGIPVMDGALNWNSAWPQGDYDTNFDPDEDYISHLGGRSYMAAFSPWFFTHYGPDTYNKNFIFRCDNWHFSRRWELLVDNRDSVAFIEALTWNDFGESHYLGPVHGDLSRSDDWTVGYDHQGWLDLLEYYIQAYKTGVYPTVSEDRVFFWSRLSPAAANAPDRIGKPDHWQWTEDFLWAVVLLTAPAEVRLTCGDSVEETSLPGGAAKVRIPLVHDCNPSATIYRGGVNSLHFAPDGFEFRTNPRNYNFNAYVASS